MIKKTLLILINLISFLIHAQDNQYIFEHLTSDNGLSRNSVSSIMQDKYGFMWFGTWNGLNKYNGYDFKVYKSDLKDSSSISNNRINHIFKDSTGALWIETIDGLYNRYNYKTDNFTRFAEDKIPAGILDNFMVVNEVQESPTVKWSFNRDHLERKNLRSGYTQIFTHDPFHSEGLNDDFITSIYLDNTNVLWIGTNSGGINKINLNQKKFYNIRSHPLKENTLQNNIVREITEDSYGNLWIGTRDQGLCKMNMKTGQCTRYMANSENSGLTNNRIREIFNDTEGNIWIGTSGNSPLLKYNKKTDSFRAFEGGDTENDAPKGTIYSIYEDDFGYLWIGSFDGLAILNKRTEKFAKFHHDPIDNATLSHNYVRIVEEDDSGNIWIGTESGGLNKVIKEGFNPDSVGKITFQRFLHDPDNYKSLSDNRVYSICTDNNGALWVGTAMGLDKFNSETETFTHYNQKDGLGDDMIYGILKDRHNNLWISHDNGISKFSPDSSEIVFTNYHKSDGLQGNEFSEDAYYQSPDGKMYFGGLNGLTYFYPDSIKSNAQQPRVLITNLKILNESVKPGEKIKGEVVLQKPIYETSELNLSYQHRTITFEFAALHYADPERNRYRYKLIGFDDEWNNTDADRRYATYSNLVKKQYTFLLKGANSDGVWNDNPVKVVLNIAPPFWRTPYFYVAIVLLIGLLTYGLIKLRESKLKKDKRALQEKIKKSQEEVDRQQEEIIMQKNEIKLRQKDEKDLRWLNEGLAKFSDIISENKQDLKSLSQAFLSNLVKFVDADQGSLFLLNDDDENNQFLELTASYASSKEKLKETKVEIGEGQVGTCFKEGKHIELKNLPEGYTKITSGLGEKSPKYLMLFPLRLDENILGVVEFASFKKIKGIKVVFLEKICATVTSVFATEKANQRALKMYDESVIQAEELKTKEEELRQNLEEMQATQEELQRTNKEAQKNMKELETAKKESEEREQELIEMAEQQAAAEEELRMRIKNLEEENSHLKSEIENLRS